MFRAFLFASLLLVQPEIPVDGVKFKEDVIVVPDTLDLLYDKSYEPGDIIIVEVGNKTYVNFTWQVIGPATETKQMFKIIDGGRSTIIRSTEGTYNIFCAGSKADGAIYSELVTFAVGKAPMPVPIVVPEGFLGFTKVAHTNWPNGNKALATKLAASYRLICSKIKSNDTPEAIAELLKTDNRAITTEADRVTLVSWNKAVSSLMVTKAKDGLLVSPESHVEAFKAIAVGLESVQR